MQPAIIAEIGINGNGDMLLNRELILRAKDSGCAYAKFQAYSVEQLFPDKKVIANGKNWYRQVAKTELTKDKLAQLAEWCKETEIEFLCSAFDPERLLWLEELKVRKHKIATRKNRDIEYIKAVKDTNKPYLISYNEDNFTEHGLNRNAIPLYCIAEYPTPLKHLKLSQITFDDCAYAGISDHTVGVVASFAALSRGAHWVEKHFTLDKNDTHGPDHICSATPHEMKQIVKFANEVWQCL